MSYTDKLKNPLWQKKRLKILERDEWTCQSCGDSEATLHVHHGYYTKGLEPWEYADNTLTTYCEACHEMVQELMHDWHLELARTPHELQFEFFRLFVGIKELGQDVALKFLRGLTRLSLSETEQFASSRPDQDER